MRGGKCELGRESWSEVWVVMVMVMLMRRTTGAVRMRKDSAKALAAYRACLKLGLIDEEDGVEKA